MSQNLESILAAAHELPPEELQRLIERLLSDVSIELHADDELRREILEAEQQIRRGEVASWSEVKRRHEL